MVAQDKVIIEHEALVDTLARARLLLNQDNARPGASAAGARAAGGVAGVAAGGTRTADLTTGLVLRAMLESPGARMFLASHNLTQQRLAAAHPPNEGANSLALCRDQARALVEPSRLEHPGLGHLLVAFLQNEHCQAHRWMREAGVSVRPLLTELRADLALGPALEAAARQEGTGALVPRLGGRIESNPRARRSAAPAGGRCRPGRLGYQTSMQGESRLRAAVGPHPERVPTETQPGEGGVEGANGTTATHRGRPDAVGGHSPEPAPQASGEASRPSRPASAYRLDPKRFPLLSGLGRNLSEEAACGQIDPVVGRDHEIEQVLDVLARRRGNNPVLVGPSGVGKTAIVEGLALRIVAGGAGVQGFEERCLIELSAGALVSGTAVRGALAEKLSALREEVSASEGRVLLFLDEIHGLVGSGEGPDEIANDLKSALARGQLPCIGATTEDEYRGVFENDPALARRFSRVQVGEPSEEATLQILDGISEHYQGFHGVGLEPDALRSAVELSARYIPDRFLPDKAIGLMDMAAARTRRRGGAVVDREAVAAVISEQVGVPLDRLLLRDGERLLKLEERLGERVVGQARAVEVLSDSLRRSSVGLRGARRPMGVFLLLGPTGVGKTELAKAISEELFPSSAMTRLDMSEFSEPHAVARLFGAPPGYLGHESGGQLTEAVRRRPYQLVLLDEVEKAHLDVLLAMLPLLDEGHMTDGRGRRVDFTNTVVVMTSNLGAPEAAAAGGATIGFGSAGGDDLACASGAGRGSAVETRALAAARGALPPELWNRIDETLYLSRLGRSDVARITRRMLADIGRLLSAEQGLSLEIDESVLESLIDAGGYDPELGARPMRRTIAREVEAPIAAAILAGELGRGDHVRLYGEGCRVRYRR